MTKADMHCVGKYLRGSGMEDTFVETEAFGLKVAQSVIEGYTMSELSGACSLLQKQLNQ